MNPPGAQPLRLLGGRYRLREPAQDAAVAPVWHGDDQVLGTQVEARRLPRVVEGPGRQDQERLRQRQVLGARRARQVYLRAVTPVLDVVEEGGDVYVVTEEVGGRPLAEVLRESGPLSVHRAARVGLGVLDAMRSLQPAGLGHDLLPEHVLLDGDAVVLSGAGLLEDAGGVTGAARGAAAGPEARRRAGASGRAALGPLGALLQTMLDDVPDGEGCARCTPRLADLVRRLLAADLAARPGAESVRAVLADVAGRDAADVVPPGGTPPGTGRSAAGSCEGGLAAPGPRRHSRALLVGATAVLALLAVAGYALLAPSSSGSRPAAQVAPSTAATPAASTPPAVPEAVVPAGWETYRSPDGGVAVAHPPGWKRRDDALGTRFVSSSGLSSLYVLQRPVTGTDVQQQGAAAEREFAAGRQAYRRLRLGPTAFRGQPAYEWEARFVENGAPQHASALAVISGGQGYLLYVQSAERTWAGLAEVRRGIRDSFTIRG